MTEAAIMNAAQLSRTMRWTIPETDRDNFLQRPAKFCDIRIASCACPAKQERYMYDAIHAVANGAVPEHSKSSSAGGGEDYARPKGLFLRKAAVRTGWLLVLLLRNISNSATPLELTYGGTRMAISRLVTEDEMSEKNLKLRCRVPDFASSSDFTSSSNGTRGPSR
ncbi:hypothetical protein LJR220_005625 [Bradyrhizobium sp. LjRoot220]|uniref:hypothetical protein n=1 Tax=Bradyrhizobium sp. LjRoot220 TaxID=3342284 RepID=UPI003ECD8723